MGELKNNSHFHHLRPHSAFFCNFLRLLQFWFSPANPALCSQISLSPFWVVLLEACHGLHVVPLGKYCSEKSTLELLFSGYPKLSSSNLLLQITFVLFLFVCFLFLMIYLYFDCIMGLDNWLNLLCYLGSKVGYFVDCGLDCSLVPIWGAKGTTFTRLLLGS